MIEIELKKVCMECGHADLEIIEYNYMTDGEEKTLIRCKHAPVCYYYKTEGEDDNA